MKGELLTSSQPYLVYYPKGRPKIESFFFSGILQLALMVLEAV